MKMITLVIAVLLSSPTLGWAQGCYSTYSQALPQQQTYAAPQQQIYAAPQSSCYSSQAPQGQSYAIPAPTQMYAAPATQSPCYGGSCPVTYQDGYQGGYTVAQSYGSTMAERNAIYMPPTVEYAAAPAYSAPPPVYRAPPARRGRVRTVYVDTTTSNSVPPPLFPRLSGIARGGVYATRGAVYGAASGFSSGSCPGGICR